MAQPEDADATLARQESETLREYPGFSQRCPATNRFEEGNVRLVELPDAQNITGGALIIALPGVGATSTVVGSFLISNLDLRIVALIESQSFPAMCSVHKWNATSPMRIYGNEKLCVVVSDHQVNVAKQGKLVNEITRSLIGFAERHNLQSIIAVNGHPVESDGMRAIEKVQKFVARAQRGLMTEDDGKEEKATENEDGRDPFETIHFVTTDPVLGEKLLENHHKPVKSGSLVGFAGSLLGWSYTAGTNGGHNDAPHASVLLAPDPMKIPDQRGALIVVKFLKAFFELELDLTSLETEAKRLLDKIQETVDDIYAQLRQQIVPKSSAPPVGMYM